MKLPSLACQFSFDDLYQARFGRAMSDQEKQALYALSQTERNQKMGEWAKQIGWHTERKRGSDGKMYTAFWKGGEIR